MAIKPLALAQRIPALTPFCASACMIWKDALITFKDNILKSNFISFTCRFHKQEAVFFFLAELEDEEKKVGQYLRYYSYLIVEPTQSNLSLFAFVQ